MSNCTFNQMWDDCYEDREVMIKEYMTDDYISHLFTEKEIIYIRDTIEASVQSQTFDDFCEAIKITGDSVAEEFDIPYSEIESWRNGTFPIYIKRMIAFFAVTNELEYKRAKTCQACGSFFFSADSQEPCCDNCRGELARSFLEYYLAMRDDPNIN